ncbi:hypothetical protein FKW77_006045 [Venturia effusa]|uniref:Uncharacterized protein n=1 Tax=Venturia effusa TaxID=50376 RepID=A0A517LCG0_9PEZI|nr:hypothetical protein FKW77_006045 [Venturia effusa]
MTKHAISEDRTDADAPAAKRLKVDTPTSSPPTTEDSASIINSPESVTTADKSPKSQKADSPSPTGKSGAPTLPTTEDSETIAKSPETVIAAVESPEPQSSETASSTVKAGSPTPPTSDSATKSEIEAYFEHHFHKSRVFASPDNHPDLAPDYNISSTALVSALKDLSDAALKHFQDEYLDDVYVFIDRLDRVKEFAPVAIKFPKIGGRIKLDSRMVCDPEKEKMPQALDSKAEQEKLGEKIAKLNVWKREVKKMVHLVGEQMDLDEEAFKEKLTSIKPLAAKANEPLARAGTALINPVADDLKVLKDEKDDWSVTISCDSVLADEEKQRFQLWGDIGAVSALWKYFEAQKEEVVSEPDVVQAGEEDLGEDVGEQAGKKDLGENVGEQAGEENLAQDVGEQASS